MRIKNRQVVMLLFLMLWPVAVSVSPTMTSDGTRSAANASAQDGVETIFANVASGLDNYGRPTIFRLTFEYTAGVGPEDLLPPFTAYVESGTLVYRDPAGDYTDISAGEVITVHSGDDYAFRNQLLSQPKPTLIVLVQKGSCLIHVNSACEPHFLPYDFLCENPCRRDITTTLFFNHQELIWRLMDVVYTLQHVTIGSDEEYAPVDPGGDGDTIELLGRVEIGNIQTSTGEVYSEGDTFTVESGQTVVTSGSEGAEIFLLRVAKQS